MERRAISREDIGVYNAVIIGATYEFPEDSPLQTPSFFFPALKQCIEEHAFLGVTVKDAHIEKSYYQRVPSINLQNHISIDGSYTVGKDEWKVVESILPSNLDAPFPSGIPPWRIVVLPFSSTRCFIVFAYSHALGDGPSGMAFHRTFMNSWRAAPPVSSSELQFVKVPNRQLPVAVDTPERLPISWGFLLAPLLNHLLPQFLQRLLGLRPAGSAIDANTWTGSVITNEIDGVHTKLKLQVIEAPVLERALKASREQKARLTGVFHELVTRALSESFKESEFTNFVAQTPVNLRRCLKVPTYEFGNLGSACYTVHSRIHESAPLSEIWEGARSTTQQLVGVSSSPQDQVIGLLRYVSNIRKWLLGKRGERRECSFEVSNIGVFSPDVDATTSTEGSQVKIVDMLFTQPGHVLGSPLAFSLTSAKGGSLVYTASWEVGGLGVKVGDEDKFVDGLLSSIKADFEAL